MPTTPCANGPYREVAFLRSVGGGAFLLFKGADLGRLRQASGSHTRFVELLIARTGLEAMMRADVRRPLALQSARHGSTRLSEVGVDRCQGDP